MRKKLEKYISSMYVRRVSEVPHLSLYPWSHVEPYFPLFSAKTHPYVYFDAHVQSKMHTVEPGTKLISLIFSLFLLIGALIVTSIGTSSVINLLPIGL